MSLSVDMKLLTLTSRRAATAVAIANESFFPNFHLPQWSKWLGRLKGKSTFDGSFHQAVAPVLFVGQCFTLMPVVEIFSRNPRNTRFKLLSVRFAYTAIYLIAAGFYSILACRRFILRGLNVSSFADMFYLMFNYIITVLFLLIAIHWQKVLKEFANCERLMLKDAYTKLTERVTRFNLAWRIRMVIAGIMVLAFFEDFLNFYSAYQDNYVQMDYCNRTEISFWENFYIRDHPQVFQYVPVNIGSILFVEWINRCLRYTWTYLDLFIISFSYAAQFRYTQIYQRLVSVEGTHYPTTFWREIRTDYVAVSQLVAFLDEQFGHLILLSCANDMYFIATQLFNGFQRRPAFMTMVYFWYSLALLIFRTLCMLYIGSGVHVASMSPLNILRNVPSKYWGLDLQRLTDDVASGENTLSGKKFFYLKRQIILAMAGTLVTYELVLMDQVKQAPDPTTDCSFY
ncbi:gustatory receptor for sugar taste 64b [Aedes aegypti]|uniref:Gustatory receptor n=1 Tax=Aedes aegypti TaxID=7159 RepID=A0A6I8TZF9_AEDAE|nr:gustatory receptor 10 [Aedes aegypti]